MSCPYCKETYVTASGLSHHLETGSCPNAPHLNRESIHRIIRKRDPSGLITKKQITYGDSNVTYSATDRAFNGNDWECYICHQIFGKITSLEQHLNSPKHKQKVYHCPNGRCEKEFVSLAGLFQHLESESCAFMRFERVQKEVGKVFSSNRMIAF